MQEVTLRFSRSAEGDTFSITRRFTSSISLSPTWSATVKYLSTGWEVLISQT